MGDAKHPHQGEDIVQGVEGSDFVLEENMVFNFDMPYQEYGWGSMHIEDTMCITADGFDTLTSGRTGLRVL